MNKYVLMKAPKREGEYSSQIVIIDNSRKIGKEEIQNLFNEGYSHVGYIESDLRIQQLMVGFEHNLRDSLNKAHTLFNQISTMADSHLELMR
ncbi:hypothetical protein [Candidatus Merdisoma sp. JLR.KK006]|uniref:hypothetical protein n=1 Tax=Candidatus Merdisoma sp. JLR.KK006 TaxID=3112626 RepID=UPI002FF19BC6